MSFVACSQSRIGHGKLRVQLTDASAELNQGDLGNVGYVGFCDLFQERLNPGEALAAMIPPPA